MTEKTIVGMSYETMKDSVGSVIEVEISDNVEHIVRGENVDSLVIWWSVNSGQYEKDAALYGIISDEDTIKINEWRKFDLYEILWYIALRLE